MASVDGSQRGESGGSFLLFESCRDAAIFSDRSSCTGVSHAERVFFGISECEELAREFKLLDVSRNDGVYLECAWVVRYEEFKSCSELIVVLHSPYE